MPDAACLRLYLETAFRPLLGRTVEWSTTGASLMLRFHPARGVNGTIACVVMRRPWRVSGRTTGKMAGSGTLAGVGIGTRDGSLRLTLRDGDCIETVGGAEGAPEWRLLIAGK